MDIPRVNASSAIFSGNTAPLRALFPDGDRFKKDGLSVRCATRASSEWPRVTYGFFRGTSTPNVTREDIFVATKVWITVYGYGQTFHAFDKGLRKLGLDYLDLYLTHWPVLSAFDGPVAACKAAMKLLAERRVRPIGVCNLSSAHLHNLIKQTGHIPEMNQIEVHPFFIQSELRDPYPCFGVIMGFRHVISGSLAFVSPALI